MRVRACVYASVFVCKEGRFAKGNWVEMSKGILFLAILLVTFTML